MHGKKFLLFLKKVVDKLRRLCYNSKRRQEVSCAEQSGGLAQLGERLHGMQEVTGSIPVFSTRLDRNESCGLFVLYSLFTRRSRKYFQFFAKTRLTWHGSSAILNELSRKTCANIWGISSAGRALAWHARGHRFDPGILHHKSRNVGCGFFFTFLTHKMIRGPALKFAPVPFCCFGLEITRHPRRKP